MDGERREIGRSKKVKKKRKEKKEGGCREIGYWNIYIDPHFKFKFRAAPVGILKHIHTQWHRLCTKIQKSNVLSTTPKARIGF
jgi:hypothetical protein